MELYQVVQLIVVVVPVFTVLMQFRTARINKQLADDSKKRATDSAKDLNKETQTKVDAILNKAAERSAAEAVSSTKAYRAVFLMSMSLFTIGAAIRYYKGDGAGWEMFWFGSALIWINGTIAYMDSAALRRFFYLSAEQEINRHIALDIQGELLARIAAQGRAQIEFTHRIGEQIEKLAAVRPVALPSAKSSEVGSVGCSGCGQQLNLYGLPSGSYKCPSCDAQLVVE